MLRVTTKSGEEYRVWLTRRFTSLLFKVLEKEMDKLGGISALGNKQQTRQMFKSGVFDKQFEKEKSVSFPLGEQGFLAFGIKSANNNDGSLRLELLSEAGPGVTINLNPSLLYMMHNLISQGLIKAEWQHQVTEIQDLNSQKVH